jgi:hypothetical protein
MFGTVETVTNSSELLPNTNTSVTLTLGTSRTKEESMPHTSPRKSHKRALELTPVRRQVVSTLLRITHPEEPPRLWGAVRRRVIPGQLALPAPEPGPGHQGRPGGPAPAQN